MGGGDVKPVIARGPPVYGWHYPMVAAAPAAATPQVQAEPTGPNIPIQIRVTDQEGSTVPIKVKTHTRFIKMFNAYCDKKGVDPGSYKFLFDGEILNSQSWPGHHGTEDDDVIQSFIEQQGGRASVAAV